MNRINRILNIKGKNQTWLAEHLKKSYNMINLYAQNRRQPIVEDLNRIADLLNVDVKDLLVSNKSKKIEVVS